MSHNTNKNKENEMYINISMNLKSFIMTGIIAGLGYLLFKETDKVKKLTKENEEMKTVKA